jgi:hypothetical protein
MSASLVGVGRYQMLIIPTLSHLLRSWVSLIYFGVRHQLGVDVRYCRFVRGLRPPAAYRIFRFSTSVLISSSCSIQYPLVCCCIPGPILPLSVWYSMSASSGIIAPGSSYTILHFWSARCAGRGCVCDTHRSSRISKKVVYSFLWLGCETPSSSGFVFVLPENTRLRNIVTSIRHAYLRVPLT